MPFTPAEEQMMRKMFEEMGVRSVNDRYFHCIDSGNWELLATCFTEDASFEFSQSADEKKVLNGIDAITAYFQDRNRISRTKTHYLCHAEISVADTNAKADVYAISNIVIGDRVAIRGLRYADELVKGMDGNWRFKTRRHRGLWQYYAAFVKPELPKA